MRPRSSSGVRRATSSSGVDLAGPSIPGRSFIYMSGAVGSNPKLEAQRRPRCEKCAAVSASSNAVVQASRSALSKPRVGGVEVRVVVNRVVSPAAVAKLGEPCPPRGRPPRRVLWELLHHYSRGHVIGKGDKLRPTRYACGGMAAGSIHIGSNTWPSGILETRAST